MKIFKLIRVIAVIGIGLWTSAVHADPPEISISRNIQLDATPAGVAAGVGGEGFLKMVLLTAGNTTSGMHNPFQGFADGSSTPFADLNVKLPCREEYSVAHSDQGARQFYVLYIAIGEGDPVPIRIFSFNTSCIDNNFYSALILPFPHAPDHFGDPNPEDWFNQPIEVTVVLELDDGNDAAQLVVLSGTD